jgi:hypothetical protein
MSLQVDGRSFSEKNFMYRGLHSDPTLFQGLGLGDMHGRTVQQLPDQSNLRVELPFYQGGPYKRDGQHFFFEQRDVQHLSSLALPPFQQDDEGVYLDPARQESDVTTMLPLLDETTIENFFNQNPLKNKTETLVGIAQRSFLSEPETMQDPTQNALSETSNTLNKRKGVARKKAVKPLQQKGNSERSLKNKKGKIDWSERVVKELITGVEEFTDKENPEKHRVDWELVGNKVSAVAGVTIDPNVCRDAYMRRYNPNLKSLTPDIKHKIIVCLKNGEFTKDNGSILYAKLATHFSVAENKVRDWLLSHYELEDDSFFQQFRQKEAERVAFYAKVDNEGGERLKKELLKKASYLEDGTIDCELLSARLNKSADRLLSYIERHQEECEQYKQQAFSNTSHSHAPINTVKKKSAPVNTVKKKSVPINTVKKTGKAARKNLRKLFDNKEFSQTLIDLVQEDQKKGIQVGWTCLAEKMNAKLAETTDIQLDYKTYRNVYVRQLDPQLNSLTEDIKQKIQTALQEGKFRNEDESVDYVELNRQYHVGDHMLRYWIKPDGSLRKKKS